MSQSESAYSAIADWHWTTSNTPEVAVWAPYGDVGTSQRQSGDVRTWGHVGKIGPWWCVWMTIPRLKHLTSSCNSQSAGGAGGDVATLDGSRRRISWTASRLPYSRWPAIRLPLNTGTQTRSCLSARRSHISDLYLTGYLTGPLLPVIFCALRVLTGFDVNELPSVLPNAVQYWRCTYRVNTLQFYSNNAQIFLSKLHEHCLIRFALCRIWNVCRNPALRRNGTFIRRIRCALSPIFNALYSNTSLLILISYLRYFWIWMHYAVLSNLTALFPNYVHCFQNWPEKGVHCTCTVFRIDRKRCTLFMFSQFTFDYK